MRPGNVYRGPCSSTYLALPVLDDRYQKGWVFPNISNFGYSGHPRLSHNPPTGTAFLTSIAGTNIIDRTWLQRGLPTRHTGWGNNYVNKAGEIFLDDDRHIFWCSYPTIASGKIRNTLFSLSSVGMIYSSGKALLRNEFRDAVSSLTYVGSINGMSYNFTSGVWEPR